MVDAAQGIEAQTLANVYLALDHDLDVMPVINKIDLPSADPERVVNEIEDVIGIEAQDAPRISAKNGINIEEVLEQIVKKVPAPHGDPEAPLKALIFDSPIRRLHGHHRTPRLQQFRQQELSRLLERVRQLSHVNQRTEAILLPSVQSIQLLWFLRSS